MKRIDTEALLEEIRRLADGAIPPTVAEMRDEGEYSAKTYINRFGSWNEGVEAAGFDPRTSVGRPPGSTKGDSANVSYLLENGPSTADELPTHKVTVNDRAKGVWSFDPHGTDGGGSCGNTGGTLTGVYYLRGDHNPDAVVQKWADVNEHNIEESPTKGIRMRLRRQGSEFHDAIDRVVPRGESV